MINFVVTSVKPLRRIHAVPGVLFIQVSGEQMCEV